MMSGCDGTPLLSEFVADHHGSAVSSRCVCPGEQFGGTGQASMEWYWSGTADSPCRPVLLAIPTRVAVATDNPDVLVPCVSFCCSVASLVCNCGCFLVVLGFAYDTPLFDCVADRSHLAFHQENRHAQGAFRQRASPTSCWLGGPQAVAGTPGARC